MSNKLTDEEIIGFVKDMFNKCIVREQLANPTKEFVVDIYARFLIEFGVDNISQPDIIATSGMDNIERYETNILLWNIQKCVANIVVSAGVPDMTFADIVLPKRARTNRILSALCLLCYRFMSIEQKFTQMQTKCVDLPVRRQAVEERTRELKRQIEEKSMYLSSNKSKSQGLAQELKKLAETHEHKTRSADQLREESAALKAIIVNKREKLSELEVEVSKMKEEIQDLDQKIVKSPERIQSDTTDAENELEVKRNEKKKLEKAYMELTKGVDRLKDASKALMPSLDTFAEAFKDIETMKSQCQRLVETKHMVSKKEENLKSLSVQIKEHEKNSYNLKQQIVNNEKQFQQQIQTMKKINKGMKKDLELKTKNQSATERNALEERIRLESKLDALDVQHKQFKEKFDSLVARHKESVESVYNLIESRMNEIKSLKQNTRK